MPSREDFLERLDVLTRHIHAAAGAGDLPRMESTLIRRRAVIDDLPELLRRMSAEEQEAILAHITGLLALDREAEAILERSRAEIGAELQALGAGRRGLEGYGGPRRRPAKWIDERG